VFIKLEKVRNIVSAGSEIRRGGESGKQSEKRKESESENGAD